VTNGRPIGALLSCVDRPVAEWSSSLVDAAEWRLLACHAGAKQWPVDGRKIGQVAKWPSGQWPVASGGMHKSRSQFQFSSVLPSSLLRLHFSPAKCESKSNSDSNSSPRAAPRPHFLCGSSAPAGQAEFNLRFPGRRASDWADWAD